MGARQEFAFGAVYLKRERQFVPAIPCVLGRHCSTGDEVRQRRGVRCRGLGALACDQVEVSQLLALLWLADQRRAAVELTHDLEDRLTPLLGRRPRHEKPPDPGWAAARCSSEISE